MPNTTTTTAIPTGASATRLRLSPLVGLLCLFFFINLLLTAHAGAAPPPTPLLLIGYLTLNSVITSQPVLLAMWAVFVPQRLVLRIVGPSFLLGILMVVPFVILPDLASRRQFLPTYCAYQIMLFAIAGSVFTICRGIFHWRISASAELSLTTDSRPGSKYALRDFFWLIWLSALALGASRWYGDLLSAVLTQLLRDGWHSLAALVFVPYLLTDRRRVHFMPHIAVALFLDFVVTSGISILDGREVRAMTWLMFAAGFFLSVAVALLAARRSGFRLSGKYDGRKIE